MKQHKRAMMVCGMALASTMAAQAAVVYSTDSAAPSANVVASYDVGTQSMSARNNTSQTDRTLGQTFTLGASAQVNRISVQMAQNVTFTGTAGSHILWLAISSDTDSNGSVDTQVGSTYAYDLSGFSTTKDSYLTFEFDTLTLGAGIHGFEFGWREDGSDTYDDDVQNLAVYRTTTGAYAGGGQISMSNYTGMPNTLTGHGANDVTFYVQTIPEPATLGMLTAFGAGIMFIRRRFLI